jgi:predicted Zn-dependent protease
MKAPADGWDGEERDAIDELRDELETLRARHRDDPEVALLRAARHAVLPPEVQQAADDRLLNDAWSRALVDGLDAVEPSLDKQAEDQLLVRIRRESRRDGQLAEKDHQSDRRRWTWYRPALASAAVVAIAAAAWIAFRGPTPAPVERPIPQVQPPAETSSAAVTTPPAWQVPLDKPDVTLSLAALTWRGSGGSGSGGSGSTSGGSDNQLLADLKEPLDGFRNNDYARADRAFAALESRYPNAVEVFFYGGVSRLFVNDPRRAIVALTRAADLADATFAPRTAWYLAIAEERAGDRPRARARLDELCRGTSDRAAQACAAVRRIDASAAPDAR